MTSPHPYSERIQSLDVLRGFALLGILIMNIQHFSMPSSAYMNPASFGDLEGVNYWAWVLSHILASNKFMTLFSILFGAGILIFAERAEARDGKSTALHYRRMLWLLLFGLMHAYLLWSGDILVSYALCGMLAYLFRNKKLSTIWIVGLIFFLVPPVLNLLSGFSMPYWPEESKAELLKIWAPGAGELAHDLEIYRSGWWAQMALRVQETIQMQTTVFFMGTFWRVMALMLLGMALVRTRIITAERSRTWYLKLFLLAFIPGILLEIAGVRHAFALDWDLSCMFTGSLFGYFGSMGVAMGYLALIMLLCIGSGARSLKQVLANVGRMAFSNYILMTLLGTLIFHGHGLGLYGRVERGVQLLFVLGIWLLVLIFTQLWLKYFKMGPLEAFWRSLTYGKRIQIRKAS